MNGPDVYTDLDRVITRDELEYFIRKFKHKDGKWTIDKSTDIPQLTQLAIRIAHALKDRFRGDDIDEAERFDEQLRRKELARLGYQVVDATTIVKI